MSQKLKNILKSLFCIFLATDDEKLIVDDDDDLYIVIKGFDSLSEFDKHAGVIKNIEKSTT